MPDAAATRGRPVGTAVHATAVAIDGRGMLIVGPSGSGKSRLAAALIAASSRRERIRLIGDDRILLTCHDGELIARSHPRIAGFMERRGLGLVAMPCLARAPVAAVVDLGLTTLPASLTQNLRVPLGVYVGGRLVPATCDAVLAWWRGARTTPAAKAPDARLAAAKD